MSQHKCGSSKPKIKKNSSNILQSKHEWSYTILYTILNRQYCQTEGNFAAMEQSWLNRPTSGLEKVRPTKVWVQNQDIKAHPKSPQRLSPSQCTASTSHGEIQATTCH